MFPGKQGGNNQANTFTRTGRCICQNVLRAVVTQILQLAVFVFPCANVNPFIVVCCVSFVTRLMARKSAITSMNIGMFLIPISALLMACGNLLGNDLLGSMSNITLMMILGIVVQALAECFISPRYLEYFSLQAPKGEEGMYLGFSHLHSFLSSIFGFGLAGILLTKYCPDPALFETREAWMAASANAHYIWYYFAGIGLVAAFALLAFAKITNKMDKKG